MASAEINWRQAARSGKAYVRITCLGSYAVRVNDTTAHLSPGMYAIRFWKRPIRTFVHQFAAGGPDQDAGSFAYCQVWRNGSLFSATYSIACSKNVHIRINSNYVACVVTARDRLPGQIRRMVTISPCWDNMKLIVRQHRIQKRRHVSPRAFYFSEASLQPNIRPIEGGSICIIQ